MADVSRGDIVTRGGLSFVVWTHGQGEVIVMPIDFNSGKIDHRNLVTMQLSSVVPLGLTIPTDRMKELRENRAGYVMSDHSAWDDALEKDQEFFNDGRYHAAVWGSDGGYWVQPTHVTA